MWTQLPGKACIVGHRVKATCSGWVLWEVLQKEGPFIQQLWVAEHTWTALPRENKTTLYEASLGFFNVSSGNVETQDKT